VPDAGQGQIFATGLFSGSTTFQTNPSAGTATITVPQIKDNSPAGSTSGTVKAQLWFFLSPYSGGSQTGYVVAEVTNYNGTLAGGGGFCGSQTVTVAYKAPPSGVYYPALLLEEFSGSGFVTDNYINYTSPVTVGSGGATNQSSALAFIGASSFQTNPSAGTVTITVPEIIDNSAAGSTSGTVKVQLWYFPSPYTGAAQTGYNVAEVTNYNGTLSGGGGNYGAQTVTVSYTAPPGGTYYAALLLEEFTGSGYVTDN